MKLTPKKHGTWAAIWTSGFLIGIFLCVEIWSPLVQRLSDGNNRNPNQESAQEIQDKRIADYTQVVMIFTGILAAGTLFLWWETRRLAKGASKQEEIVKDQAAQLTLSNQHVVAVERAFVFVESLHQTAIADSTTGQTTFSCFNVIWGNSGSTPTSGLYVQVNWAHFDATRPLDTKFGDLGLTGSHFPGSFIAPKSRITSQAVNIPVEIMAAAAAGQLKILIWGWAEYDDVFEGSPHAGPNFAMT